MTSSKTVGPGRSGGEDKDIADAIGQAAAKAPPHRVSFPAPPISMSAPLPPKKTSPPVQDVVAGAVAHQVGAVATAVATVEKVVAALALRDIVPRAARGRVVAGAGGELVIAGTAQDAIPARRAGAAPSPFVVPGSIGLTPGQPDGLGADHRVHRPRYSIVTRSSLDLSPTVAIVVRICTG